MVTLDDLIHNLDLGFSRLNFDNNYSWGITSDITPGQGKKFPSFICYIRRWSGNPQLMLESYAFVS